MPVFDPTKPAANSPITSSELRNQFNALNDGATAFQSIVTGVLANVNSVDTLTTPFTTPPTAADLELLRNKINELLSALYS
jgi:hypothetical protein